MKLGYKQVADFLKRPKQAAGVLIYGPDEGLVRERVKTIITAVLGEKPDPFSIIEITESALKENPTKLFEEASAMGFLVNERVIVLKNPPEKIAPDIESIIPTLDPSTYLIVSEAELTPRAPMRQLFEQHQKLASLACYKDEAQDISAAVRAILTKHGLAIRPDALHALTQRLGNDRAVTSSEAEKIALYKMGESEVTLADIDALIPDNSEHEASDVAYALVSGNAAEFDHNITALMKDGVQPIAILRGIQRHVQRLHYCHALIKEGRSQDEAMKSLKPAIFFKEEARFRGQLQALPMHALGRLLKRVTDIEAAIKTGSKAPELAIAELTQLSYRARAA